MTISRGQLADAALGTSVLRAHGRPGERCGSAGITEAAGRVILPVSEEPG